MLIHSLQAKREYYISVKHGHFTEELSITQDEYEHFTNWTTQWVLETQITDWIDVCCYLASFGNRTIKWISNGLFIVFSLTDSFSWPPFLLDPMSSNDLCLCEEGSCSFAQFRILMFMVHDRTLNTRSAHVSSISLVENMILEAELEPSSGMSKHILST